MVFSCFNIVSLLSPCSNWLLVFRWFWILFVVARVCIVPASMTWLIIASFVYICSRVHWQLQNIFDLLRLKKLW
jgi:hypothetical protein